MTLEQQLGIKISSFIAGLMGGTISLTYEHHIPPLQAILMILAGGFTAGYAFAAAETYWGLQHSYSGVFGFWIGLIAMRIIDIIMTLARKATVDPSILLSWANLLKSLKQDGESTSNSVRTPVSTQPSLNSSRTEDKATPDQVSE